jgi:hypothetical protein
MQSSAGKVRETRNLAFRARAEAIYLYEETAKEFEIDQYASSFEDMAQATHNIYFEPRPKAPAPVITEQAVPAPTLPTPAPIVATPAPDSFLYFAYGSNMLTRRLKARTPSATAQGTAFVDGHRLTFDKKSTDGSGKCDIEATENPADRVYGVLFTISAAEAAALDKAEGLDHGCRKGDIQVVTPTGTLPAVAYFATDKDTTRQPFITGIKPSWLREL